MAREEPQGDANPPGAGQSVSVVGGGRSLRSGVARDDVNGIRMEMLDERMVEIYRAMTPGQRLAIGFEAHEFAWKMCLKRERDRRPGASEDEIIRAAWDRMSHERR